MLSLFFCFVVVAGSDAVAQSPPTKVNQKLHSLAAPPPAIDPSARDFVYRMCNAYDRLTSFSVRVEGTVQIGKQKVLPFGTTRLAFQRPARVAMTRWEEQGQVTRAVADGKYLYVSRSTDPGRYAKMPLPQGRQIIYQTIEAGKGGDDAALLAGYDILSIERIKSLKSLQLGPSGQREGVPTRSVIGIYVNTEGEGRFIAEIGKTDFLLRRWTEYQPISGRHLLVSTARYQAIQINPKLPQSTFTFAPLKRARAVAALDPPLYDMGLKVGQIASLKTTDSLGKPLTLEHYRGKVVLLDYWASWCGPCLEEVPALLSAYRRFHSQGFEIIGISLDDASTQKQFQSLLKRKQIPWRQVCDGKGFESPLVKKYKVQGIPFKLLIGKDGKILHINPRANEIEPLILRAFNQK